MSHSILFRNLAIVAARRDDHDAALELYRRAWETSGGDLYLFGELDLYLAERDRHAERLELYDQLDEQARTRSIVAMRRGKQLLDNSRYNEAVTEYTTRTFLRGEQEKGVHHCYVEAIIGAAWPHIDGGDCERARQILAKGLEYPRNINVGRDSTKPNEAPVRYLLGVVEEKAGRPDQAREHYLAAAIELHRDGSPAACYEMLAWMALGNRARGMAVAHTLEQLARGERRPHPYLEWLYGKAILKFGHGLAQLVKGRPDEARQMWREALAENPDARWVRLHLDMPDGLLEFIGRCPGWPEE
ncbi:hypothetical protein LCGC14_1937460 [marine sediment metagenome]|uniref:Tetratricopeptide repeat protein n=1 Tax=marine sediment metagenome TaxID=412755 RepID=A0A0F9FLK5_9ZZZZ